MFDNKYFSESKPVLINKNIAMKFKKMLKPIPIVEEDTKWQSFLINFYNKFIKPNLFTLFIFFLIAVFLIYKFFTKKTNKTEQNNSDNVELLDINKKDNLDNLDNLNLDDLDIKDEIPIEKEKKINIVDPYYSNSSSFANYSNDILNNNTIFNKDSIGDILFNDPTDINQFDDFSNLASF